MSKSEPESKTNKESETDEIETEAISNVHRELAILAAEYFEEGDFSESLSYLNKLQDQRPLDIRFTLNAIVVELFKSDFQKVKEFKNKLYDVCSLGEINLHNTESLDDVRNCYFYFNKAVLLFHSMQYDSALQVLEKVSSFQDSIDAELRYAVFLLIIQSYLYTHQPKRSYSLIKTLTEQCDTLSEEKKEVVNNSLFETFRNRLNYLKCISCFILRRFDHCNKEFESLLNNPEKVIYKNGYLSDKVYEARCFNMQSSVKFLKAYSEYLQGSLKSCVQIMSTIPLRNNFNLTGESVPLAFYNNMGCAHLAMRKPNLATLYFQKALKENENNMKANGNETDCRLLFTQGGNMLPELMYNLGISLLHCGKPSEAFDCLTLAVQVFYENPKLWLRLAECCIMVHKNGNEGDFDFINKRRDVLDEVVGTGIHRKLILNLNLFENNKYSYDAQSFAIPVASLEFATLCLRNALTLVSDMAVEYSPSNPNLRASIQVASAYVSLCLGDPIVALNNCKEVIASSKGINKVLAHLYIAEAYILLDNIPHAIEHLRPNVVDYFFPTEENHEKMAKHWKPDNSASTKAVFQYNMAVVLALKGDLQKAAELLKQVWLTKGPQCEIPVQIISLALYIELSLGHADIARNIIKQNCPQYNVNSTSS